MLCLQAVPSTASLLSARPSHRVVVATDCCRYVDLQTGWIPFLPGEPRTEVVHLSSCFDMVELYNLPIHQRNMVQQPSPRAGTDSPNVNSLLLGSLEPNRRMCSNI